MSPTFRTQAPTPVEQDGPISLPYLILPSLHLCEEMPITGGHFHEFAAIEISWIMG